MRADALPPEVRAEREAGHERREHRAHGVRRRADDVRQVLREAELIDEPGRPREHEQAERGHERKARRGRRRHGRAGGGVSEGSWLARASTGAGPYTTEPGATNRPAKRHGAAKPAQDPLGIGLS